MNQQRELVSDHVPPTKGPYSQGVLVGASPLVFTSGLVGRDPDGDIVGGGVEAETRQTLRNLEHVLAEAGAGLADVIKMTVYLRNKADYQAMNAVREELFADIAFASSTIICDLHPPALVEIEVVAIAGGKDR